MANYTIKDTFKQLGIKILGWLRSNCVNNCTSTSQSLPLAASQGKALQEQITTLNSNLSIKVLVNEAGAKLVQIGHVYMLFLQGFDFFPNSAIVDKIIKYAPSGYQVRSVVGDYENKTTYILALSSNNKTLINIKIWQEVPNTTATGIHGSMVWVK